MPIDWLTPAAALLTGLIGGVHCAAMCGGIADRLLGACPRRRLDWRRALEAESRPHRRLYAGWRAGRRPGLGIVRVARTGVDRAGIADAGRRWCWSSPRCACSTAIGRLMFLSRGTGSGHVVAAGRCSAGCCRPTAGPAPRGWACCGAGCLVASAPRCWPRPGCRPDACNGALTMAAFGLGTLPLMWPLTWSGARLGHGCRRGGWRVAIGSLIMAAGLLTLAAPWLMQVPALHRWLVLLGCVPAPI